MTESESALQALFSTGRDPVCGARGGEIVFANDAARALSDADGAGMGLYIAQGIARLHGGALLLRSKEGEGTRICLSLPLTDRLPLRDDGPKLSRGPQRILTELADLLPSGAYRPQARE